MNYEDYSLEDLNRAKRRLRKDYLFYQKKLISYAEDLGEIALKIERVDGKIRSKNKEESQ